MSTKELDRLGMIREVEAGRVSPKEAAEALSVTVRHFRRLRRQYGEGGPGGLAHALRGRVSNRRTPEASRAEALRLVAEKYWDFGPTLASEKLCGHGIAVSRETVRKWMTAEGMWKPKKRREYHRAARERRRCFGEMVQMDGSRHRWFEDRGGECVLIAMIDDATSRVVARFFPSESMAGLMKTLRIWLETWGRPRAVYADRHSLWVGMAGSAGEREETANTQMRRALRELGIEFIAARSPQAKGRVERLFGTLQDRLVKEMRLGGIDNIADANRFLEEKYLADHNRRFAVEPASKADAHRRLSRGFDLDLILSERHARTVANDYTVRWNNRRLQIAKPALPGLRGGSVELAVVDGAVHEIFFRGKRLVFHEIRTVTPPARAVVPTEQPGASPRPSRTPWAPPSDHPWRKYQPRSR